MSSPGSTPGSCFSTQTKISERKGRASHKSFGPRQTRGITYHFSCEYTTYLLFVKNTVRQTREISNTANTRFSNNEDSNWHYFEGHLRVIKTRQ